MTHFGILCFPGTGHLNPLIALGRELQSRGHQITFFQIPDTQQKVLAAELDCQMIGQSEFPLGWLAQEYAIGGTLKGLASIHRGLRKTLPALTAMSLREAPAAIQASGAEALLVDQMVPEGGTIAEFLGIPFVTVCSAVPFNIEPSVPPSFTPWRYNSAGWASLRNRAGYCLAKQIVRPIWNLIGEYRCQWKLPPYRSLNDFYSPLAQLSQLPAEFEFPRPNLPDCFHFTGPLIDPTSSCMPTTSSQQLPAFPFEKLTGQPLIYASMGTILNRKMEIFQTIAEACAGLDFQLVMSLGRFDSLNTASTFPGSPLVVGYAPQLDLFPKTALMISHAGLNTTLEALSYGVPQVAIPVGTDQPGVASRIAWAGVGEVVSVSRLTAAKLSKAIENVLACESYRKNAAKLQASIRQAKGVSRAAEIIEQVIATKEPVLAQRIG
jgi:MGT family glycosyltransferase